MGPRIPPMDRLLGAAGERGLVDRFGRLPVREALREAADGLRRALADEPPPPQEDPHEWILSRAQADLEARYAPSLRPVLNLTGTVLHTNLGRAPLPPGGHRRGGRRAAGGASQS